MKKKYVFIIIVCALVFNLLAIFGWYYTEENINLLTLIDTPSKLIIIILGVIILLLLYIGIYILITSRNKIH